MLVLLFATNVAFAGTENADAEFEVGVTQFPKISVTWKTSTDVQKACNRENRKQGLREFKYPIEACSFWNDASCLVITKPRTTMHIVGHEIRHCFQQQWH